MPARLFFCAILLFASCLNAPAARDFEWVVKHEPFYRMKSRDVDILLSRLHRIFPNFHDRLKAVALLQLGTPYERGCLGEEKPPDRDPLFRLDKTDCTVFVMISSALAHGKNLEEARELMKSINYHPVKPDIDPVSYENRVHFTYDRITSSTYFQDITRDLLPPKSLVETHLILNKKSDGSRLLPINWEKEVTAYWIPAKCIGKELLQKIPSVVAGVGFIRKKNFSQGIIVSHEGMIIDREYLVHADSIKKRVLRTDFLKYLRQNSDYFDGVLIYEFLERDLRLRSRSPDTANYFPHRFWHRPSFARAAAPHR